MEATIQITFINWSILTSSVPICVFSKKISKCSVQVSNDWIRIWCQKKLLEPYVQPKWMKVLLLSFETFTRSFGMTTLGQCLKILLKCQVFTGDLCQSHARSWCHKKMLESLEQLRYSEIGEAIWLHGTSHCRTEETFLIS